MIPRRLLAAAVALAATALAQAHPGHDDGHELTWDFTHLADHPVATALNLALAVGVTWAAWRLWRRGTAGADQSLRGSQASRGK